MKEETPQEKYKKMLNCPVCGSGKTYYRHEVHDMVCEKCGNVFERPEPPKPR